MSLTARQVRALLDYNPETGALTWRPRKGDARWSNRWAGKLAGCHQKGRRSVVGINNKTYLAHRVMWAIQTGRWPQHGIDHANGDPSDNRWTNLRRADQSENVSNAKLRSDNRSGHKGVFWLSRERLWVAKVGTKRIGYFANKQQAIAARVAAAKELHGDFFRLQ